MPAFTDENQAEYPLQDRTRLLAAFTAELLARQHHAEWKDQHGKDFDDWVAPDEGINLIETMFLGGTLALAHAGALKWPDGTEGISAIWCVEGPRAYGGEDRAPAPDWIKTFGYDTRAALEYAEACRVTGVPHRLKWKFRSARS